MHVSILHWNRPHECRATLAAIQAQGVPLKITVIDNASSAIALDKLKEELPPEVELIVLPRNVGWGPAHNVVLRRWLDHETSDYCVVAAHDALPAEGCLSMLRRALDARPEWGMACPEYGRPELPAYSPLRGARLRPTSPRLQGATEDVEFCHGTLMVFRRACLQKIGLFDERHFAYGDETEIGLRARNQGWKVGLVWGAVVVNPGTWTGNAVVAYLSARNSLLIARTISGRIGMLGRLFVMLAAVLREFFRGTAVESNASPRARWMGIRDYFLGRTAGPPAELLGRRTLSKIQP